jgi:ankyrin repeat protein
VAASKQNTSHGVIDMLIDASASLGSTDVHCIADRDGKLPLHHAAASGRAYDSAMRAILASNPSALMTRDRNGNFPVMLAAIDDNSDINVVYNLLKETPNVVSLQ